MIYEHGLFKCPVCGYEYEENCDIERGWEVIKGDEEFIRVKIISTINYDWSDIKPFNILMCPKCKNIRGE